MKGCPDCQAVAQQLLGTPYATMASQGDAYHAQAVESLVSHLRHVERSVRLIPVPALPAPDEGHIETIPFAGTIDGVIGEP